MTNLGSVGNRFQKTLNKITDDKKISKPELKKLAKEAKSETEKNIVETISQSDQSEISFSISRSETKKDYKVTIDLDLEDDTPSQEDYQSKESTDQNSLGVGDPNLASNVSRNSLSASEKDGLDFNDIDSIATNFSTPEKVSELLGDIEYDTVRGQPFGGDGPLGAQKPEDTLSMYSGVCRDMHQVGAMLLSKNGYEAVQMGYVGAQTSHSFLVYKGDEDKGYGVVEYGKVYSSEQIAEMNGGRPATSPEEALNILNYGSAAAIYKWSPPQEGKEAYVEGVFYTEKYKNYHQTLKLEHKDSIVLDKNMGLQIEKTLGEKFSIKLGVQGDHAGDPTGKGAMHTTVGFKTGNQDNWFSASIGAQYRFNDGSRIVGSTDFLSNPTLLGGGRIEGQWRPFKAEISENHFTSTTFSGRLGGAFLALNKDKHSDSGSIVLNDELEYDLDYVSGLADLKIKAEQSFYGEIIDNTDHKLKYSTSIFAEYDGNAAVAGMFMGAKNPLIFANAGVKGNLGYQKGSFDTSLSAKYMFQQVNNLENTSVGINTGYKVGPVRIGAGAQWQDSLEGSRFKLGQSVTWDISKNFALQANASQEIISPEQGESYTNPGGINGSIGIKGKF